MSCPSPSVPGLLCILFICFPISILGQPQTNSTLYPDKDNTLIESATGSFSNGKGPYLYVGRVGTQGDFTLRRAVIRFNLEEVIPTNETILEGKLSFTVTRLQSNDVNTFSLHRLTTDWGEGTSMTEGGIGASSTANDATWIHAAYPNVFWSKPGGDFMDTPSSTIDIGPTGKYIIENGPGLLEDLRFWHQNPQQNFGWILISNEDETAFAVKQIGSREQDNHEIRPQLEVTHEDPALPVELGGFEGVVDKDKVTLRWWTASELNNAGFEILHKYDQQFEKTGFIEGAGTTNTMQQYMFEVPSLVFGKHEFRLKQIDFDGSFAFSPTISLTIDEYESQAVITIYPTPFNPETNIDLYVQQTQHVVIEAFDMLGRNVARIAAGTIESGINHTFQFKAADLPTGIYFIRVQGDTFRLDKSVIYQR